MMVELNKLELTPLEIDLLDAFHSRYSHVGFPKVRAVRVERRENTGAGRFTYLSHDERLDLEDGQLDLGEFSQINMDGLNAGASFWVQIENRKVLYLEIAVNGDQYWDGAEYKWIICDPDTGEFLQ